MILLKGLKKNPLSDPCDGPSGFIGVRQGGQRRGRRVAGAPGLPGLPGPLAAADAAPAMPERVAVASTGGAGAPAPGRPIGRRADAGWRTALPCVRRASRDRIQPTAATSRRRLWPPSTPLEAGGIAYGADLARRRPRGGRREGWATRAGVATIAAAIERDRHPSFGTPATPAPQDEAWPYAIALPLEAGACRSRRAGEAVSVVVQAGAPPRPSGSRHGSA
jgi:hypothetical protein